MNGAGGQFIIFLQFLHCGAVIGILHFLTHPVPVRKKHIKLILDLVFSVLMILTIFLYDYIFGQGEMKTFYVVGIVLGAYLYYKMLKNPLDRLSLFVYNKIVVDLKGGEGVEKSQGK